MYSTARAKIPTSTTSKSQPQSATTLQILLSNLIHQSPTQKQRVTFVLYGYPINPPHSVVVMAIVIAAAAAAETDADAENVT